MFRQIIKKSLFLPCNNSTPLLRFNLPRYYSSLPSSLRIFSKKCINRPILSAGLKIPHQTVVVRTVTKFVGPMTRLRLQHADRIPPKYELIYRIDFGLYLVGMQGMSVLFVVVVGVALLGEYLIGIEEKEMVEKEPSIAEKLQKDVQQKLGTTPAVLNPRFEKEELLGENNELFWVLFTVFALLTTGVLRILRRLPVRIYGSPTGNHRLAVYYSSFIPGKTVVKEFVAGTVERVFKKKGILWTETVYKDATGKQMLLLPQFFREPLDFHTLLKDPNDVFVEDADEF